MRSRYKLEDSDGPLLWCIRRFRPDVRRVRLTPIATGKFNDSYFVEADDEALVLRVAPPRDAAFVFYERDMMRQEPGIHRTLLEHTTVPVAPIVGYDDSLELLDRDYLLMERLPGRPLSEAPCRDTDAVMAQVGDCLAQAHRLTADAYGYVGEHHPMAPQPTWNEAFALMWRMLIDDVRATGHYTEDDRTYLLGLLDHHLPAFDRDVPASLLHMDVWGQNLLTDGDRTLTGLIDWDRALWGDPEIEFAVLDYCGISVPAFWEGYGQQRDASPAAAIRTVFYLLYEIQKYIVIRHGRSHEPAAARAYKDGTMQIARQCLA